MTLLSLSPRTLEKDRTNGTGPADNALAATTGRVQFAIFAGAYEESIPDVSPIHTALVISSVQLRLALEQLAGGLERQKRYAAKPCNVHRAGLQIANALHADARVEAMASALSAEVFG